MTIREGGWMLMAGVLHLRGCPLIQWGPPSGWLDLPPPEGGTILLWRDGRVIARSEKRWAVEGEVLRLALRPDFRPFTDRPEDDLKIPDVKVLQLRVGRARIVRRMEHHPHTIETREWDCLVLVHNLESKHDVPKLYDLGFQREF